jgi:hypothetical protein
MNKRTALALLLILSISLFAAFSCSSKESAREPVVTDEEADKGLAMGPGMTGALVPEAAPPPTDTTGATPPPAPGEMYEQKIIKTADIRIEVKDFKKALAEVQTILREVAPTDRDGYIANSSSTKSDSGATTGTVVIRIVPGKFDLFIEKLMAVGDVKSQQITGEDITKEYYDLLGSLDVKEGMETRLLQLLATRTNNVADLLEVERELGRVRGEINNIKGTIRYYDNLVGKSTVNVTLSEPEPVVSGIGGFWRPIKNALRDSLEIFGKSIGVLIGFIAVSLPWIVVAFIAFYLIRRNVRKKRAQAERATGAKAKMK